jgi:hypothetical protein
MEHQPIVPDSPRRPARHLHAVESILGGDHVVRERIVVEDVSELTVELGPLVVADLQEAILDANGVIQVDAEIVFGELGRPSRQIAPVEKLNPLLLVRTALPSG